MNRLLYSLFESSNGYVGEYDRIFRGIGPIDFAPSNLHKDADGWVHGIDNFPTFKAEIAAKELLWKINGKGDLKSLLEQGIHMWSPFAWRLYNYLTSSTPITELYSSFSKNELSSLNRTRIIAFEDRILSEDAFEREWGYIGTTPEELLTNIAQKAEKYGKSQDDEVKVQRKFELVENHLYKLIELIVEDYTKEYYFRDSSARNGYNVQLIIPAHYPDRIKSFKTYNASFEMKESFGEADEALCSVGEFSECDSFSELPYAVFQGVLLQCIIAHLSGREIGNTELHLWCPYVLEKDLPQSKNYLKEFEKKELAIHINPEVKELKALKANDFAFSVLDRKDIWDLKIQVEKFSLPVFLLIKYKNKI